MHARNVWIGIALAVVIAGAPKAAAAFCAEGPYEKKVGGGWEILRVVPVYLKAGGSDTTWNGMDIEEVEYNIRAAIHTWWGESGSDIRPYYAGRTSSSQDSGRILIRDTSDCMKSPDSSAIEHTNRSSGHRVGSTLWFEVNSCHPGQKPWSSIPEPQPLGSFPFRRVLIHEMGHALGLDHPNDPVGTPICEYAGTPDAELDFAIMAREDNRIRKDDRDGMILMYGVRNRTLVSYSSSNMLSWSFDGVRAYGLYMRPQTGGLPMSTNLTNVLGVLFPVGQTGAAVMVDNFSTLVLNQPDTSVPEGHSWQPTVAVSGPTDGDWLLAWTRIDEDNREKDCAFGRIAVTRTAGASWIVVDQLPNGQELCSKGPPTATWDPRSGLYIVFWDGPVQYVTYNLNGVILGIGDLVGDERESLHTPAIACGNENFDNCLIVWDSVNPWGCVTMEHTEIGANSKLELNPLTVDCWIQEDTPAISYRTHDPSLKWGLVIKQQETLFSARKTAFSSLWQDERTVVFDPNNGVSSGAIRSYSDLGNLHDIVYAAHLP